MDETTRQKLQAVLDGYRSLGVLFQALLRSAADTKRLNRVTLTPALNRLATLRLEIEQAKADWWFFYSHVDASGNRVVDLGENEQEEIMIRGSFDRNHTLVGNLQDKLLELIDRELTAADLLDLSIRAKTLPHLAGVLSEELVASGLLH